MKGRFLVQRLGRRVKSAVLSAAVLMSAVTVPVYSQEPAESGKEVIAEFVGKDTTETVTVSKNEDVGTEEYMADCPFMNVYGAGTEYLNMISTAQDALEEGKQLSLEVSVTVEEYTPLEGRNAQLVIYSMNDTQNWQQNQKDLTENSQTCTLSLTLGKYEEKPVDFLGMRVINCVNASTVKYTIHYARVIKKDKPQEIIGKELAVLVEPQTTVVGIGGENNNEWGTDYNGKNIYDDKLGGIPHLLKWGLDGFTALKLQVSITIDSYSAEHNVDESGNPGKPSVVLYIMDSEYNNWKQDMAFVEQTGQQINLSLDLIEWGQKYVGEFGVRFGGFDPGEEIHYTVNYASIVGEGEGASAEKIELQYPLTGEVKNLPMLQTPVGMHGKLSVAKTEKYAAPTIVDKNGMPYQLRGASSHGLSWFPEYINKGAFQSLRDEWGMNLVRIAVYAREGGYTQGHQEEDDRLIQKGVQAATELGMYVILDWHVLNYNPHEDIEEAKEFFTKYVEMYKGYDNVLFEICNEPTNTPWYSEPEVTPGEVSEGGNDLYTYCKTMTELIRDAGSDAIVICGTNQYSSEIDKVAEKPLSEDGIDNVMYTYHFYSATHKDADREKVKAALEAGTPVFVSEYGVCNASGNGAYDLESAEKWLKLCDTYNVSYACWAMSNSEESAAYFVTDCEKTQGGWLAEDVTNTGRFLINYYRARQQNLCEHTDKEIKNQKEASCKTEGYTGDVYCNVCGVLVQKGSVVSKTEVHSWNDGVITTVPTTTSAGVKTYTCSVCGITKTEGIKPLPNTKKKVPKKGTILKFGKNSYKVTKAGATVSFVKTTSKSTTLTIPARVKIGGITYKVTSINAGALKGNKRLSRVVIGANVTAIGSKAFSGCTKLTSISIPSGVVTIGSEAFRGCSRLGKITIKSTKLKSVGKNALKGIKSTAKVKVPFQKLKAYKRLLKGKGQGSKVTITK